VPTSTLAAAARRLSSAGLTQAGLNRCGTVDVVQLCAPGLWGPDPEPLTDPLSNHTLTQAQHTYARQRAQSTYDELLWDIGQPPQLHMQTLARLRSVACESASAWMEAVPTAFSPAALRWRIPSRPASAPRRIQPPAGRTGRPLLLQSPLRINGRRACPHMPSHLCVLHHDAIVDVVRSALRRGGLPSTKEPGLAVLHASVMGPRPPGGARRHLLFSLEGQQCLGDVSVIQPGSATYCAAAARTNGGMRTKRPSTAGTEQAATGSCPSQWRPAAALVGPSWTCSPLSHSGLASTATAPARASSLSRACSANFPSACAAATLLSSGRWLVALCG
jgi:hypothetical protein